ncbi:LPXTG cell wall anchor domain-containing protein, partial [Bifidobacterium longum]
EPGDSDEPCEPEEPETAEETAGPSPESSLPITGGDVAVASVLAATALAVGLVLLIIVRRRQL